jgi:uncharacterized protein (DUF1800 family)
MNSSTLWSLRLGFSGKQALEIDTLGLEQFLKKSYSAPFDATLPAFLHDEPKTIAELREYRQKIKNSDSDAQKKLIRQQIKNALELKKWWIKRIRTENYPLREKMVCFWHNHFVATTQKVKSNYWVFQHNYLLREHAFGNFKQLTKVMIQTNAMVRYLDNVDNKKGKINENLSRELLELFTLGIGNYSENDIKEGARALAGLGLGEMDAQYRPIFEDNGIKTYFGQSGNFKADDLVDIIFEQKNIPYLLTRKILKWFIYDAPAEELVTYYGDYLREVNFEMEPFLNKIFTEESKKNNAGSKIKDPLVYIIQLIDELNAHEIPDALIGFFTKQQGMDLLNQPNLKGWDGGNSWLTSQIYLQRNNASDLMCNGKNISRKVFEKIPEEGNQPEVTLEKIKVGIQFNSKGTNKDIIAELSNRLLFQVTETMQKDMENLLKYDFDPKGENAQNAVLRLFNYITKTPEYQLI